MHNTTPTGRRLSGPKPTPLRDRILAKIEHADSGCWNWTGFTSPDGYGRIKVGRTTMNAHRAAYIAFRGEISPASHHVDHLCRNRRCVNPDHLEPVTAAENTRRGPGSQTHCKHGHEFAGDNLAVLPDGRRKCRACHRRNALASYYRLATGAALDGTTDDPALD